MRKATDPRDNAVYVLMPGKEFLPPSGYTCDLCFRNVVHGAADSSCGAFIQRLGFTCNSSRRDTFAIPVPDTPEAMEEFYKRVATLNLEK